MRNYACKQVTENMPHSVRYLPCNVFPFHSATCCSSFPDPFSIFSFSAVTSFTVLCNSERPLRLQKYRFKPSFRFWYSQLKLTMPLSPFYHGNFSLLMAEFGCSILFLVNKTLDVDLPSPTKHSEAFCYTPHPLHWPSSLWTTPNIWVRVFIFEFLFQYLAVAGIGYNNFILASHDEYMLPSFFSHYRPQLS